jgi:signal transduction histidine kinase
MKLPTRLFISVTALITLIMLGVVFSVLTREREIIQEELRKKGHTIAKLLAMSSINFLLTNDYSTMKRFTETIATDEDVKHVMILDPSGLVKMHNDVEMIGEYLTDQLTLNSLVSTEDSHQQYQKGEKEDLYDISESIIASGKILGIVRIGISTRKMNLEIAESRNRILFMGVLTVLVGMVGSLVLGKSISRPIKNLVKSAEAISRGELDVKLEVTSKDEVGILTAAFRDMAEALKRNINGLIRAEQLMTMGKMAAGLAHEIKNPLEAIKGSAVYLEGKYAGDKTITKFTGIIKDEIHAVVELIDDYLLYARPTNPRFASKDVNTVIEETLKLVENLIEQNRIGLKMKLEPDLPSVLADSIQMKQVFMNLILNAIEAMPAGGTLFIRTCLDRVPMPAHEGSINSPSIVIQFSDTGKGIPGEHLEKIFDPFYTTKEKGSGLGLSISQGIVERHNGRIFVESNEGAGSAFRIVLPVHGVIA